MDTNIHLIVSVFLSLSVFFFSFHFFFVLEICRFYEAEDGTDGNTILLQLRKDVRTTATDPSHEADLL